MRYLFTVAACSLAMVGESHAVSLGDLQSSLANQSAVFKSKNVKLQMQIASRRFYSPQATTVVGRNAEATARVAVNAVRQVDAEGKTIGFPSASVPYDTASGRAYLDIATSATFVLSGNRSYVLRESVEPVHTIDGDSKTAKKIDLAVKSGTDTKRLTTLFGSDGGQRQLLGKVYPNQTMDFNMLRPAEFLYDMTPSCNMSDATISTEPNGHIRVTSSGSAGPIRSECVLAPELGYMVVKKVTTSEHLKCVQEALPGTTLFSGVHVPRGYKVANYSDGQLVDEHTMTDIECLEVSAEEAASRFSFEFPPDVPVIRH